MTYPTANIFGRINCRTQYSAVTGSIYMNQLAGDYYTSLYNFLSVLSNSYGITELIAMNTGSGGTGVGYWDQSPRFGIGPFSVWRFKPYQNRTWDWYFYIHTNSGSTVGGNGYEETAAQTPTKLIGSATFDGSVIRSVIASAALCFSASLTGSDSFNPWGGSTSIGATTKSNPVWVSGSNNNTLAVFPRQNNLSGSNVTNKDNCLPLFRVAQIQTEYANTFHFWSDGHSIMTGHENVPSNANIMRPYKTINFTYFGPFTLTPSVATASIGKTLGGTGSQGFVVWRGSQTNLIGAGYSTSDPYQNLPNNYGSIGQITNSTGVSDGGMFVTTQWGVRNFQFNIDTTPFFQNMDPSGLHGWDYLELPLVINIAEAGLYGSTGQIDSPLIRVVGNTTTPHCKSKQNQRIAFGNRNDSSAQGQTLYSRNLISVPWPSGSNPLPPMVGTANVTDRNGQDFAFLNYTGQIL